MKAFRRQSLAKAIQLSLLISLPGLAAAQETTPPPTQPSATTLDTVTVTGTRIKQTNAVTAQPVFVLDRTKIEQTGLQTVGELLQQLTSSGKALNAKFNSSGNFGYPPDGGGIGAGSAQVDLRNLGSQRTLVLVDGVRWVNESSASGVSGSADLNTIPMAIVERVEVLEDGASAIYGSDAIAGVINIITRRTFDGAEANAYYGQYDDGGETTDISLTLGGSGERWSGVFTASYFEQEDISSASWDQSAVPEPGAGPGAGSSGVPQGRFVFCDPRQPVGSPGFCGDATNDASFYSVTLNDGTATPVWDPNNPNGGTYHRFAAADRFNFAPFNLLLTPQKRKSIFTNLYYDITDNTRLHVKGLYNNRTSTNQAAPEPIFVGPDAGTGGIADTISVAANNPYNPFGIALTAGDNFSFIGRRPLEVGPRIFTQDVDTSYFNIGLDGVFDIGSRNFGWDANYAHGENKAEQTFLNGYNVAKIKTALGDPAVCAQVQGCVPLDLFGGQTRPMTQDQINWIRTRQIDSSEQVLDLYQANVTGDMFNIGDRTAGFAAGVEHRRYRGEFNPDPLRQTGESQDSQAFPVKASYDVDEVYSEFNFPILSSLELSAAIRYSDYSTFGSATTGKVGFRWQPIEDLVLRGTWSEGFRAPNLGELYGLTQFGATLTDPCGPTGAPVVDTSNGVSAGLEAACVGAGVPNGFEQANTQIITFTGGNPDLDAEESENYTVGAVYAPSWAEGQSWSNKLDFEVSYYNYKVDGAIQAADIQSLLDKCYEEQGGTGPACAPFARNFTGNLFPPQNRLANLGTIETDGADFKVNWLSPEWGFGHLTGSLQSTWVNDYEAVDQDGNVAQRAVGIEVNDSAIPEWQTNVQLGWGKGNWDANWNIRYISSVEEDCTNATIAEVPGCLNPQQMNTLGSVTYNDFQVNWKEAFTEGLKLTLGVNNAFGKEPPICVTCSLNGYDAGTYDLPGAFWYVSANYRF
ncbi:iron complex outermembrane receptor protein [Lysobacter niastensis]|uniref:Iron complex outermembrane receptor protein n=1 Tax=Lysobacter niastensis TaxID=380629 RepID=A0ABU1W6F2_9GAMM|nr:TonB-dependent receptor [Lysobacter niastensis]MDR7133168.1 iron complex outermembrane receptor protein [Lysobacter niastensis]